MTNYNPEEIMSILMEYNLEGLKFMFKAFIGSDVPEEMLQEPDKDYVKSNIARSLLKYFKQTWKGDTFEIPKSEDIIVEIVEIK
jgi:hypothetical protein